MMEKKYKVIINGIERIFETINIKEIEKRFRHKLIKDAIKNTHELTIQIFSKHYIDNWQTGGWSITHKDNNQIISCKDVRGDIIVYNINELVSKKLENLFKESSFELIMCPYCGGRLNRIELLLPTSCITCEKHNFKPLIKEVIENNLKVNNDGRRR